MLFASLPLEGHALPLLFWATSFEQIRSGTSENDLEETLMRRLVLALPQGVRPVLVADRSFGWASFLLFLEGAQLCQNAAGGEGEPGLVVGRGLR